MGVLNPAKRSSTQILPPTSNILQQRSNDQILGQDESDLSDLDLLQEEAAPISKRTRSTQTAEEREARPNKRQVRNVFVNMYPIGANPMHSRGLLRRNLMSLWKTPILKHSL